MEKTIKKKTSIYAAAAIILATVILAFSLNYGTVPSLNPAQPELSHRLAFMKTFSSQGDLRNFLVTKSQIQGAFVYLGPLDAANIKSMGPNLEAQIASIPSNEIKSFSVSAPSTESYSTTNIQVAGVDEADMVKTDGEYIYVLSNRTVFIVKAYPADQAAIVSKLTFNDTYPVEIFVSGDRLAVLECKYNNVEPYAYPMFWGGGSRPYTIDVKTSIEVYDITDRANPVLSAEFKMSGSYFNSRMIGDYVYLVTSQPAYVIYDTVILPKIYLPTGIIDIPAEDIQYLNTSDDYYQYTTIVAMNIQNASETPAHTTMLLGGATTMYVSMRNIYLTFPDSNGQTAIYRIYTDGAKLTCEATGKIQGSILNQFSMDENGDYFRIVTSTWENGAQTNLYVLDMNLTVIGSIKGIAPGEAMNSARFIENRCYLSTSVARKDPFFVIDVENPTEPRILGDLKVPGFTSYLHPFDADHIIGIGRDENSHVKITLYDVTDVSAPVNMSEFTVEGLWSDTPALSDYKAFLFDAGKNLMVIPLSVNTYEYLPPTNGTVSPDGNETGMPVNTGIVYTIYWQGAYIFKATLDGGFELRGNVTHLSTPEYHWDNNGIIKRTLYIQDDLYTVSDSKIQINDLETLQLIKEIALA